MSEDPKMKKPGKGINWLRAWLIVVAATFVIIFIVVAFIPGRPRSLDDWLMAMFFDLLAGAIIATIFVGLWAFTHWLCCWRNLRKFLFGCACLLTLVALLYAEEDWRAKHDWESFQHEWEAKGESFDRQSIIPPAVPDDQNFAMSAVWIAEIKFDFLNEPKRAEAWYGDRIYDENVSNFLRLVPFNEDALTGTNAWQEPGVPEPESSGDWEMGTVTDLKPWQVYYRNLAGKNPALGIPTTPQPQTPAADVLLALSKYDPVMEQLRQDSQRPESRFPIQYDAENPMEVLLPHLAALKRSAQALELHAVAELQAGQTDKAFDDVKLMLRLTDAIRTEPILISQLVRFAMVQITLQPIYEGLAAHQWSDAQLAELDTELAQLNFPADYRATMRGEMIGFEIGTFDFLRHHPEAIYDVASDMGANKNNTLPLPGRILIHLIPDSYFYRSELNCARAVQEDYLPIADVQQHIISPSAAHRAEKAVEADTAHFGPYNFMERMMVGPLVNTAQKFAYAQSSAELGRVAIALERYRLAHGTYPSSLDDLSPQFMPEVPHDIINGQPLHYRLTTDGRFVLYSVGRNERDDGGVVVFKDSSKRIVNRDEGDWVWEYPAN